MPAFVVPWTALVWTQPELKPFPNAKGGSR
jgi:hypothetical protein